MKKSLSQWLLAGSVAIAVCACQQKKSDCDQPKCALKPTSVNSEKNSVKEAVKKDVPETSLTTKPVAPVNLEKKEVPVSNTTETSIGSIAAPEAKADSKPN